jgi:hypothetical protein
LEKVIELNERKAMNKKYLLVTIGLLLISTQQMIGMQAYILSKKPLPYYVAPITGLLSTGLTIKCLGNYFGAQLDDTWYKDDHEEANTTEPYKAYHARKVRFARNGGLFCLAVAIPSWILTYYYFKK